MEKNSKITRPLGLDFGSLAKAYIGAISKKLEDCPIDRYFYFLVFIEEQNQDKNVTQKEVCNSLNIDKASLVRILDYLSDKGLIIKKINPSDRREHLLSLTEKGQELVPAIKDAINETNKEALHGFSGEEVEHFYKNLFAICENLSAIPSHIVEFELKKIAKDPNLNE